MGRSFAERNARNLDEPVERTVHLQHQENRAGGRQRAKDAQRNSVATTVMLAGAKSPKLAKSTTSQNASTTRKAAGIELLSCSPSSNHRVRPRSVTIPSACA